MLERAFAAKTFPVRLSLDGARRIVALQGEAVLGWLGGESAGVAEALAIPEKLLAPSPTTRIVYGCNLPLAEEGLAALLDAPGAIGPELEDGFLAASLPGGQIAIVTPEGEAAAVHFRWACLTAQAATGAVWRCYVRSGGRSPSRWRAIEHEYIFELDGGVVANAPRALALPCAGDIPGGVTLVHQDGTLTSFPCSLGRVKVTKLASDGWPRRRVLSVTMHNDSRIVAFFSDGRRETIAMAAPSSRRAARAGL